MTCDAQFIKMCGVTEFLISIIQQIPVWAVGGSILIPIPLVSLEVISYNVIMHSGARAWTLNLKNNNEKLLLQIHVHTTVSNSLHFQISPSNDQLLALTCNYV